MGETGFLLFAKIKKDKSYATNPVSSLVSLERSRLILHMNNTIGEVVLMFRANYSNNEYKIHQIE